MTDTTTQHAAQTYETIAWLRTRQHVCCVRCGVLFDLTAHRAGCIDAGCGGCVGAVSAAPLGVVCDGCA